MERVKNLMRNWENVLGKEARKSLEDITKKEVEKDLTTSFC